MEVCVDNIQSAINAANGGAQRLELCSALNEGGLTPSIGLLKTIKSIISLPVFVMLRPRSGYDFQISEIELKIVLEDLNMLKEAGADGFVFGALTANGFIDKKVCSSVISSATPLPVTFHRAFDVAVGDPILMAQEIANLGFTRLLTSGRHSNAFEGINLIKRLVRETENKLIIVPGAGINTKNLETILNETLCYEFHGSAKSLKYIPTKCIDPENKLNEMYETNFNIVQALCKIFMEYLNKTISKVS
ncbi:copper homeostasis protein cutC homolog [Daktulosphaira vitifoliae]|uniref:copper homeostasis protein cutC homolog n=1 Tax=Daktulosphaira vitifoliae TaxID=58002 RepID=UPI0021AAD6DB|nr:copper homeostasis protein cutC homolog [Daktulosphaira vitifoliae]XP_050527275.1 copper homeostasis protein cutC homolog [Daktulosphaira vitifoliae]